MPVDAALISGLWVSVGSEYFIWFLAIFVLVGRQIDIHSSSTLKLKFACGTCMSIMLATVLARSKTTKSEI